MPNPLSNSFSFFLPTISTPGYSELGQPLTQQGRRQSLDDHVGSGLPSRVPRRPLYNMLMGWAASITMAYLAYLKFDYLNRATHSNYFEGAGGPIGIAILVGTVGFIASIGIAAMSPQNDPRSITINSDPQLTRQAVANNNRETVPAGSETSSNVSDFWTNNDASTSSDYETQSSSNYVRFASPLQ